MAQEADKLKKLETQRAELNAKIQRIKARSRDQERKLDTRKKILVGAAVLDSVERGEISEADLKAMLAPYLERDSDRELFGLEIRSAASHVEGS